MKVCFLADEDLDLDILAGLRAKEPSIDILDVKSAGLRGWPDQDLLELADQEGRVLITHDRRTMTRHAAQRIRTGRHHAGMVVVE